MFPICTGWIALRVWDWVIGLFHVGGSKASAEIPPNGQRAQTPILPAAPPRQPPGPPAYFRFQAKSISPQCDNAGMMHLLRTFGSCPLIPSDKEPIFGMTQLKQVVTIFTAARCQKSSQSVVPAERWPFHNLRHRRFHSGRLHGVTRPGSPSPCRRSPPPSRPPGMGLQPGRRRSKPRGPTAERRRSVAHNCRARESRGEERVKSPSKTA